MPARLGATIHDVAQVVGAGDSLSAESGDVATLVKLLRVAMLLTVNALASAIALAFAVLVAVNSTGLVPAPCSPWAAKPRAGA